MKKPAINMEKPEFFYPHLQPTDAPKLAEQLSAELAKPAAAEPTPAMFINMDAPYEVARRFLINHHCLRSIPTLRWWNGEWRKWSGTHYAAMEDDALRAEIISS
jgi:hypothetical protein